MTPDYETLYRQYIKGVKQVGNDPNQFQGFCPFHNDQKNRSFSFNGRSGLSYCFRGCFQGNAYQFAEKVGYPNPKQFINNKSNDFSIKNVQLNIQNHKTKLPNEIDYEKLKKEALRFSENLKKNPEKVPYHWTEKVMKFLTIGLDGDKLNFPQFDSQRRCINNKRHKGIQSKNGDTSCKWYPSDIVLYEYFRNYPLFICEGEKDVTTLLSVEKQAVTSTNGALSVPKDLNPISGFKEYIIIYDNDKVGNDGAEKIAHIIKINNPDSKVRIGEWK